MITCDRCRSIIKGGERVPIQTKEDPYGDNTDWCKTCSEGLDTGIDNIRTASKLKLQRDVHAFLKDYRTEEAMHNG